MVARSFTVAFEGVDAPVVEVQCAVQPGLPAFAIVGLPNKAVSEARERVRAALAAVSVALPAKRIAINLSPADMPKDGSHYDLAIALALLAELEVVPRDAVEDCVAIGELSLSGDLVGVAGALPAAVAAAAGERHLICPEASGPEAAWVAAAGVFAPRTLGACIAHLTGATPLAPAQPGEATDAAGFAELAEVRGQERAKRALEIAAAGRHHLFLVGPPGAGKSMLAERLAGLLPDLDPGEALETSMIHSRAGLVASGGLSRRRPFRAPHHTASMAAIVGGGRGAGPGEISLAHNGVLFLDELPEYARGTLETLRQPVETGEVLVARANAHIRYPARFLLVAAANPCRCGHLGDARRACARVPGCGADYLGRVSGPLLDRFDLRMEVPAVPVGDLDAPRGGETTAEVAARVARARARQAERFADEPGVRLNADAGADLLDRFAPLDAEGRTLLSRAAERLGLTARSYHRVRRVARTVADLAGRDRIEAADVAEALSFRVAAMAI